MSHQKNTETEKLKKAEYTNFNKKDTLYQYVPF